MNEEIEEAALLADQELDVNFQTAISELEESEGGIFDLQEVKDKLVEYPRPSRIQTESNVFLSPKKGNLM